MHSMKERRKTKGGVVSLDSRKNGVSELTGRNASTASEEETTLDEKKVGAYRVTSSETK